MTGPRSDPKEAKSNEKRRHRRGERPDQEGEQPHGTNRRRDPHRAHHRGHCERERPDRHGQRGVRGGDTRRVTQPKVLVTDVQRDDHAAQQPGREPPGLDVGGRDDEQATDEQVRDTCQQHTANPPISG